MKYECEWNWELYTALHTVDVVRSIGQVDKMEFDEMGQRGYHFSFLLNSDI